jgi:hypothetical protein
MTPRQSPTRKQSLIRRSLAVLFAGLLATAWTVGISIPASAVPPDKGFLKIVSFTDGTPTNPGSGLGGPVQGRPFSVVVEVIDSAGQPTTVNQKTSIVLEEVSGPGVLTGNTTVDIPRNGSGATISGAIYSPFANGVVLQVRAVSGVQLGLDPETNPATVEVALTAVGRNANPGESLNLTDPECAAPTPEVPTCGQLLLPNGASGRVIMSVGSCDGLVDPSLGRDEDRCLNVGNTEGLVVTTIADLKDGEGNQLYEGTHATLILACDKVLCGQSGVPKLPVIYTVENTGQLDTPAPECSAKGVLGELEDACVDYVSSMRSGGDLYLVVLFRIDARWAG